MARITERKSYNGVETKIDRLQLRAVIDEIERILESVPLSVQEKPRANGAAVIREAIDASFDGAGGWEKTVSGGIDWIKRLADGRALGVEVQVSGRSDMLAVDLNHLTRSLHQGAIDVGLIVVPDDVLSTFLTDRTPSLSAARHHIEMRGAETYPLMIIAFRHDSSGPPLPKRRTNLGSGDGAA